MAKTFLEPEVLDTGVGAGRWMVVIYNNDTNGFDEVIEILMRSTGCGIEEAYMETWEAHTYGKASVHFANRDECEIVAAMIATVGVKTQVTREWKESGCLFLIGSARSFRSGRTDGARPLASPSKPHAL